MANVKKEAEQRNLCRQKMITSPAPMLLAFDAVSELLLAVLLELRTLNERGNA